MKSDAKLRHRRIAALVADGFEKVELISPMRAYRRAGAKVDVISLRRGKVRGMNLHKPAGRVKVTKTVHKADPDDYDALLLPGGFINPDLLRQSAEALEFVRAFDSAHKPIASLCHSPWVLASAGLLQGRTLTSWPGIRDDVVNAGATWLNEEVVHDRNLVTSRGPQDIVPFVRASMKLFSHPTLLGAASEPHVSSAPQANEPSQVVLSAMKWMPKPSLRTVFLLAALGAAFVLATRNSSAAYAVARRSSA
jgi:protease I